MDDLVQFLRARLDEDEQTARQAAGASWVADAPNMVHVDPKVIANSRALRQLGYVAHAQNTECQSHIARHDPARTLVEVEAKRRLAEPHSTVYRDISWLADDGEEDGGEIPVCGSCVPKNSSYPSRDGVPEGACTALRLLALPYADHPDYRDEWRP